MGKRKRVKASEQVNPNSTGGRIAALQAAVSAETGQEMTNVELARRAETTKENITRFKRPSHRLQQIESRRALARGFVMDLHLFNEYVDGEVALETVIGAVVKAVKAARKREEKDGAWIPRPNLDSLLAEPGMETKWPRHVVTLAGELRIPRDLNRDEWIAELDRINSFISNDLVQQVVLGPQRHSRVQKLPKS